MNPAVPDIDAAKKSVQQFKALRAFLRLSANAWRSDGFTPGNGPCNKRGKSIGYGEEF
ncbi:hypothetical protein Q1M63_25760 [Sinorhizobium meliloti]|nr:hypothetical protein Q1M63_25760 [Sinorhizobium meliloti]